MPRNEDVSPVRKRLALVQLQRKLALETAKRDSLRDSLSDAHAEEITARVEALSMAAATAALAGAARASHESLHDAEPPAKQAQGSKIGRAVVGLIAALAGLGALAKAIAEALKP